MKKFIPFIFIMMAAVSIALSADDPQQPLPQISGKIPQTNLRILDGVEAVQVLDTEEAHGVVANYETICKKVTPNKNNANSSIFTETNDTKEKIFITGLNLDLVTNRCRIYHYITGRGYFLYVWPIGIQTLTLDETGKTYRLKKYTVDPNVALAYYESQQKKNLP